MNDCFYLKFERQTLHTILKHGLMSSSSWTLSFPTMERYYSLFSNKDQALSCIKRNGLLWGNHKYPTCHQLMSLVRCRTANYGYCFNCAKCRVRRSALTGSIFYHRHLEPTKIFEIIYHWSMGHTNQHTAADAGVSRNAITRVFQDMRLACLNYADTEVLKLFWKNSSFYHRHVVCCDEYNSKYVLSLVIWWIHQKD